MELMLEIALLGLLGATLFHAVRLERALGVLRQDRAQLEEMIAGFGANTKQAEAGIERLRVAADGAGRQIARHLEEARALKDDLTFLMERGGRLADRMDHLVRAARPLAPEPAPTLVPLPAPLGLPTPPELPAEAAPRSQAERDLLKALRMAR